MKKLKQLSPEQDAQLADHIQKWSAVALSTQSSARRDVENTIEATYLALGLKAPRMVWCGSPHKPEFQQAMAKEASRRMMDTVRTCLQRELKHLFKHTIHRSARFKIQDQLSRHIHLAIGSVVAEGIPSDWLFGNTRWLWLPDLDDESLKGALGPHDTMWLSGFDFMSANCGLFDPPSRMTSLMQLVRTVGWAVLQEDTCWISERPLECHQRLQTSGRMQLHRNDGPAMLYRDGHATWWINCVQVNEQIVMQPNKLPPAAIRSERNAEVRRVMIDRFGRERYLREADAKLIDACPADHPIKGLQTAKLWATGDDIWLDVLNSTLEFDGSAKRYLMPIDGSFYGGRAGRECLAAVASTWRKRADRFQSVFASPEGYSPVLEA